MYIDYSGSEKPILPSYFELEEEETALFKKISFKDTVLPLKVESIMEFWVGNENQGLIAFILYPIKKNNPLCICVESDDINLLSYQQLYDIVQEHPFYYGKLTTILYKE